MIISRIWKGMWSQHFWITEGLPSVCDLCWFSRTQTVSLQKLFASLATSYISAKCNTWLRPLDNANNARACQHLAVCSHACCLTRWWVARAVGRVGKTSSVHALWMMHEVYAVFVTVQYLFLVENESAELMKTDPVNLVHMTKSLETALSEIKTQHCRRIMRSIK